MRGKLARQVRAEQLDAALALQPDLASLLSGLNDMLRRTVDVDAVAGELDVMVGALRDAGADVLMFTLPDPVPINPLARAAAHAPRAPQRRDARDRRGARRVPRRPGRAPGLLRPAAVERGPPARELRGPPPDRASPPRTRSASRTPTRPGPTSSPTRSGAAGRTTHAIWFGRYFTPWLIRRLRGRSSGDGRVAKRPTLEPYTWTVPLRRSGTGNRRGAKSF